MAEDGQEQCRNADQSRRPGRRHDRERQLPFVIFAQHVHEDIAGGEHPGEDRGGKADVACSSCR